MIIKTLFLPYNIRVQKELKSCEQLQEKKFIPGIRTRNYNKVFCIGYWKTGTTSLGKLLNDFGFKLGDQGVAEVLAEDLVNKRYDRIIRYCQTSDAFQDMPFMFPDLFNILDREFPNSKFILTIRDTPEQWFHSLVKFHIKQFSRDKTKIPDEIDLKNAEYRYKGFALDLFSYYWNYPTIGLYDEDAYKRKYIDFNTQVQEYFMSSNNLIVINLGIAKDFDRLCDFLNIKTHINGFPWENRT